MCGLVGQVNWAGIDPGSAVNMQQALAAIESRGPDGRAVWEDDQCRLGHLRLAIIDLSTNASQPMASESGRYYIVFNGEIYNYSEIREAIGDSYNWHSESDTETILAAYQKWGNECLSRLRGMFAFAIWDRETKRLFAARDRLGVKPLYYTSDAGGFAFASRPRALFQLLPELPRKPDPQALRLYLEAGYVPAPYSCFAAIRKLEPGHYMEVTEAGVSTKCYWSLDSIGTDPALEQATEAELLDQLDGLIDESIRLRLVSNVPVGAFLSGGIDSSLVVAYMKKHASGALKTFTIGFESKEFDESEHAQAIADHLGTEHICQRMTPEDLLALMPTYLEQFDEPFFDYSAFPVMAVSRLARDHVTVSLSGDGGDEAFGGYHYYAHAERLAITQRFPKLLRHIAGSILTKSMGHKLALLGNALKAKSNVGVFAFMRSAMKDFTDVMSPRLRDSTMSMAEMFELRRRRMPEGLSAAEAAMRLDVAYTLPDDYLQKVDVGSMAFSLEARDPLLDHVIMEWAARLPLKWKVRGGVNKYLLRQLAYRHMPKELLDRPKMGFGVPMADWLRGPLKNWAEQLLEQTAAMEALGLDAKRVRTLWELHQSGARNAHSCLWTILVLLQFNNSGRFDENSH
ncbi:asparagine synthase (glutamine-hydrolyzing) [Achromobacter sp. Marseille-Q0513]|uniref:asparagine synthase (glutamine-hydrolyzing) n=1 Tax=Achromobacter sp. Marseille-Q0513 TaxID=2829161 RepID=UPI001BA104C0|nr:asparagine synthase (glutamine-hydrolyzing) [Achromobacter sp. Marseille-Q0513]MBR8652315.1 asparagine synthase (glutamine-hydrolyzing) [Achromobacter sp. Marseille-Q0513]